MADQMADGIVSALAQSALTRDQDDPPGRMEAGDKFIIGGYTQAPRTSMVWSSATTMAIS